jgi:hypothetical protein
MARPKKRSDLNLEPGTDFGVCLQASLALHTCAFKKCGCLFSGVFGAVIFTAGLLFLRFSS